MRTISNSNLDTQLLTLIFILISIGIVMLYSASSAIANYEFSSDTYFLSRHLARTIIGISCMVGFMFYNYRNLKNNAIYLLGLSFILIIFTHLLTPSGQHARWLIIGGKNWLTTSDFARIALIIFTAWYLEKSYKYMMDFKKGLLPILLILGLVLIGIATQPDFSTAATIGLILLIMLYIGGASLKHLLSTTFFIIPLALISLRSNPNQWTRITSWLNKNESLLSSNWQSSQSILGLGNGGLIGQGLGNSIIKQPGLLPEVHTDFIFPVIAEEIGFIGTSTILFFFVWLFYRGIQIAKNAPDAFGMFLAFGIIINITIYVLINIGYVIGFLPTTGLPLPFFSYGGSHTLFTLVSLGILINISAQSRFNHTHRGTNIYA